MKAVDEFASHDEIIDRIKDIVSRNNGGRMVFDADIEGILRLPKNHLGCVKKRVQKTLYIDVLKLCARTGLDPMKLLF
ncbi:MAG: hypothetical protein CJD30_03640 [Sulfuricurvum sp. PD_MW2]|nr:MAG: hypothetical protein CJD30_03640 [Sulfuricurvum sp. PD_MW2]